MFENLHSTTFSCNLFLQGGFTGVKFTRISVVLKIILMEIVKLPFIACRYGLEQRVRTNSF